MVPLDSEFADADGARRVTESPTAGQKPGFFAAADARRGVYQR